MIVGAVGSAEEAAFFISFCKSRTPLEPTEEYVTDFFTDFVEWMRKKLADPAKKSSNSYILVFRGTAFSIMDFMAREVTTYDAIGAGMDYALSSLYLGNSAAKSVEVACELCIYCEKPVITKIQSNV